MAVLKQRLSKRQSDGSFIPVYLETSSDLVLRPSGATAETTLAQLVSDLAALRSEFNAKIVISSTDLTAGTSPLSDGVVYLCYE